MRTGNVNCVICGSEYEVCRRCPTTTRNTPWRVLCDTPVHYQVYHIIQELKMGILKKEEAKEMLAHINITKKDVESFLPGVRDFLLPIFDEPKCESRKKSRKTPAIEEIVDESIVEVVEESAIETLFEPSIEKIVGTEE